MRKHFRPSQWCSNNRVGECSFFTIGRVMLHKAMPSPNYLLRDLRNEILFTKLGMIQGFSALNHVYSSDIITPAVGNQISYQ